MERGYAAPMDFQWETKPKVDMTSPFAQQGQKTQVSVFGTKRTHSDFSSPSKADPPALREPNSQPFLFSQTPKKTPLRTPSFTTPQNNGKFDLDFSSGPENLSSPDQADADNEDTPEPKTSVLFKGTALPDKRHHPMFGRYGASPGPGPGRGEIPRGNYSHIVAKRVQKRRLRDQGRDRQLTRRMSIDSDEDAHARRPNSSSSGSDATTRQNTVSWLFSLIESHPRMPYILSWYMQLALNAFLILVSMRIVWSAWSTIVSDVDKASAQAAASALAEINQCARDYVSNRCGVSDRPPALHQVCENWSQCMNLNPEDVKRSQVTAAMFAGILNGFVDPISWKTMIFILLVISTTVVVSNWTLNKLRQGTAQFQHQQFHPAPPPHPSYIQAPDQQGMYTSGWQGQQPGWGPFGQQGLEYERPPSPTKSDYRRPSSPTKALAYK